jgi:hypothetical protein
LSPAGLVISLTRQRKSQIKFGEVIVTIDDKRSFKGLAGF